MTEIDESKLVHELIAYIDLYLRTIFKGSSPFILIVGKQVKGGLEVKGLSNVSTELGLSLIAHLSEALLDNDVEVSRADPSVLH